MPHHSRKIAAFAVACAMLLNGCSARPATTYQTPPTSSLPPAGAAAPGQSSAQTFQVPPGGAQAAAPEQQAAPESSGGEGVERAGELLNTYVTPAVMIVGTVVAAYLFYWGNTHWFQ